MISTEYNIQLIIACLKFYNIQDIVICPGTTNTSFVYSVQDDPFFNLFSCVDERSSIYLASGIAFKKESPVVISCTGATASRNFLTGLTEAYYKNIPLLALASTQPSSRISSLEPQVVDNRILPADCAMYSDYVHIPYTGEQKWSNKLKVNQALYHLTGKSGWPVFLAVETQYSSSYVQKGISAKAAVIGRHSNLTNNWPQLLGKTAFIAGSHFRINAEDSEALELFCSNLNIPIFCDHTSAYYGSNRLQVSLLATQEYFNASRLGVDTLILIGEISGDYPAKKIPAKQIWRVNTHVAIQSPYRRLDHYFHCRLKEFLDYYIRDNSISNKKSDLDRLYSLAEKC